MCDVSRLSPKLTHKISTEMGSEAYLPCILSNGVGFATTQSFYNSLNMLQASVSRVLTLCAGLVRKLVEVLETPRTTLVGRGWG